jgi:hypothetical protein
VLVGIIPKGKTPGVIRVWNELARAADPGSATPSQLGSAGPIGGLPGCDRTTSGRGSSTRISLSDYQWCENIINTHKYNTIYSSSSRSYYDLGSRISYTEEVWSQNYTPEDKSEFAKLISLNSQSIRFAIKENDIHWRSVPEDPSTESNPHRFGLPIDNPRQHHRQEEAVPHLHTEDSKSKAWATTLSKTYPRWPKDHHKTCKGFKQDY